jgi:hypothetical protein
MESIYDMSNDDDYKLILGSNNHLLQKQETTFIELQTLHEKETS